MHPSIIVIFVVMMIIKLFGDLEEEILWKFFAFFCFFFVFAFAEHCQMARQ